MGAVSVLFFFLRAVLVPLAFGLGAKDKAGKFSERVFKRKTLEVDRSSPLKSGI